MDQCARDASKIKKILLISPYGKISITEEGSRERKLAIPPLGIAYLAASLLQHNYEVEVLDILIEDFDNEQLIDNTILYGLKESDIKDIIIKSAPDLVGISCLISNRSQEVLSLAKLVKGINHNIVTIIGGHHPTGMPALINNDDIDFILKGEADNSILDLINSLNNGYTLEKIKGIVFKTQDMVYNSTTLDYPDVKNLPLPAWQLFSLEKYWHAGISDYEINSEPKKFMVIVTSRGCPHNCSYCSAEMMSSRRYRAREISDIINEINSYVSKYQIHKIYFWDDNFFINKARAKKLLKQLIINFPGLEFEIPSGSEINALDDEIIELLKQANFKKVFLAIETLNKNIQIAHLGKKVSEPKISKIINKIHDMGMIAEGSFMVGFPGETKDEIDQTFEIAQKLKLDRISISIVNPLPGTRLFRQCLEEDLLYEDFDPENIRWSTENIRLDGIPRGYIAKKRREVWLAYMQSRIDVNKYETEKVRSVKQVKDISTNRS